MTTNAHTPTPWEIGDLDNNGQRIVRGEHIEICTCWHHCVGSIEREMEANAAFIVRAANAHEELVAALRGAMTIVDLLPVPYGFGSDVHKAIASRSENARAVLAKLEAAA